MKIIFDLLALSIMSNMIAEWAHPIQIIKKWTKLNKSQLFNCSLCVGFWLGFLYSIFFLHFFWLDCIFFGLFVSFFSHIVDFLYRKTIF